MQSQIFPHSTLYIVYSNYNKQTTEKLFEKQKIQNFEKKDFSAKKTNTRAQFNVFSATNSTHSAYAQHQWSYAYGIQRSLIPPQVNISLKHRSYRRRHWVKLHWLVCIEWKPRDRCCLSYLVPCISRLDAIGAGEYEPQYLLHIDNTTLQLTDHHKTARLDIFSLA